MCPVARPFPHYALLAEPHNGSEGERLSRLITQVDEALCSDNIEYQSKRRSRRLGAPELWLLQAGSHEQLRRNRTASGVSDVQVKVSCLTRDLNWHERFNVLAKVACESAA